MQNPLLGLSGATVKRVTISIAIALSWSLISLGAFTPTTQAHTPEQIASELIQPNFPAPLGVDGLRINAGSGGYTLMSQVTGVRSSYRIRLSPAAQSLLAPHVERARQQLVAALGITMYYGPAATTSADRVDGDILVWVGSSPCDGVSNWRGCALSIPDSTSQTIGSSEIWVRGDTVTSYAYMLPAVTLHEMGHAMGLNHFSLTFEGMTQVMSGNGVPTTNSYRSGDRNGLADLARRRVDPHNPVGTIDSVNTSTPGEVTIRGWGADRSDASRGIAVRAQLSEHPLETGVTILPRPDVAASQPGLGPNTGFSIKVRPSGYGSRQLCVTLVNISLGQDTSLGCRTVVIKRASPIGTVDSATSPKAETLAVSGWAYDPDYSGSIEVHSYVSDGPGFPLLANLPRPDVMAAHPALSPPGFTGQTGGVSPGKHTVCSYAINRKLGGNTMIGCRDVTVMDVVPMGKVESAASPRPTIARATGWALDPESTDPISVHAWVDGTRSAGAVASLSRPEIGKLYPQLGSAHGYQVDVPGVTAGRHEICLTAINIGKGSNRPLGCQGVDVMGHNPFGRLETVFGLSRSVRISGWAHDPNSPSPIEIHTYISGRGWARVANLPRPDIAQKHPETAGAAHGFDLTLNDVPAGTRDVCVFAINTGKGANVLMECRQATILP